MFALSMSLRPAQLPRSVEKRSGRTGAFREACELLDEAAYLAR